MNILAKNKIVYEKTKLNPEKIKQRRANNTKYYVLRKEYIEKLRELNRQYPGVLLEEDIKKLKSGQNSCKSLKYLKKLMELFN